MLTPVLLFACDITLKESPNVVAEALPRQASMLHTLTTNHTDTLTLHARVTDDQYFAVPNETVLFQIADNTYETLTDAFGYASLEVESSEVFVEATVTWNEQTGISKTVLAEPAFELSAYRSFYLPQMIDSTHAVETTSGMLLSYGSQLWWTSDTLGGFGHQIANLTENIEGMWGGHLDNDGVLDAVAWTSTTAYLLRGRPSGGIALGAEYTAIQGQIVGMSIGKLDEGNHIDVAVAATTDTDSYAVVLEGDGAWNFQHGETLEMNFPIEAMVSTDENGDTLPDITVIDSVNGWIRRYTYSIEGWIGGLPSVIDPSSYIALPGSILPPTVDINADGKQDVVVYGGPSAADSQDMVFFVIDDVITKYDQTYATFNGTSTDVDSNGSDDILALSDETLYFTSYTIEEASYSVRELSAPSVTGALMTGHFNDDDLLDLHIFAEYPIEVFGDVSDSGSWRVNTLRWKTDNNINIYNQHFEASDFDVDNNIELVGVALDENTGGLSLNVWQYNTNSSASLTSETALDSTEVLDFAYCYDRFLMVDETDSGRRLTSYTLQNDVLTAGQSISIEQRSVDCTLVGGELRILVFGDSQNAKVFTSVLSNHIDEIEASDWVDAAIAPDYASCSNCHIAIRCTEADCEVKAADIDGDGTEEFIVKDGSGVQIQGWGEDLLLEHTGNIETVDVDGNGVDELLIRYPDSAFTWIYQGSGQHISSVFGVWTEQSFVGFPRIADITGNGSLETIVLSTNGAILSSWYSE